MAPQILIRDLSVKDLCYKQFQLELCSDCSCISEVTKQPRCCETPQPPNPFPSDWLQEPEVQPNILCSMMLFLTLFMAFVFCALIVYSIGRSLPTLIVGKSKAAGKLECITCTDYTLDVSALHSLCLDFGNEKLPVSPPPIQQTDGASGDHQDGAGSTQRLEQVNSIKVLFH
ncbi:uncharacterized protein LOC131952562 [Physella acuta]|uniref:uncharacterized protein LOC131952562 n=1 Tax=Physella acuta TaxID=109671 RepID=UPI0027DB0713|nr:uncharacterized protein LOC131952562 [Physella acuta]